MNRSAEVIAYLTELKHPQQVLLAPNAPPISRGMGGIDIAINKVYDSQDINDTLAAFRSRALASTADSPLALTGSFSFGVRESGRFRVNYATQRGSRVLTVSRIPFFPVPAPEEITDSTQVMEEAKSLFTSGRPGLITVSGRNSLSCSVFVYSLLNLVNRSERRVIYTLERATTYLLSHQNSVSVQCELGSDFRSMAEGIESAGLFEPDLLFVSDIRMEDDLTGLKQLIENRVLAVLGSAVVDSGSLMKQYAPDPAAATMGDAIRTGFVITPLGGEKIEVRKAG
jgi:twitching motility protein PilT